MRVSRRTSSVLTGVREASQAGRLDVAWTSLGPTDPFVARSAGRSLLHVAKLARLCELVAAMRERVDSDGA